jgi:tRNA G10  N-methylase Trm11
MKYLFLLGRQPEISTAEIRAVFSLWNFTATFKKSEKYLLVETTKKIDFKKFMDRLGGTIKIAELLEDSIVEHIPKVQPEGKISFSLPDKKKALAVKKALKALGRNVRYIEPKNTATILHNKLVEKSSDFTIVDNDVFVTIAIQPIEEYSNRDYGRPGRDNKSGMLPPKLSKIMINLAQVETKATILDPFCGSGTILTEAAMMGYTNLIGSDTSETAIQDTERNLAWTREEFNIYDFKFQITKTDARHTNSELKNKSIDAIISEPFMGMALRGEESREFLIKQANDLKDLYLNSFKAFSKILKKGGVVVFIFPSFRFGKQIIDTSVTDEIKKLGFEPTSLSEEKNFLRYHRQGQFVARNIWRFELS